MDIKPQNILVRKRKDRQGIFYKIYLTDFGIAHAYNQLQDVETEGPTSFTRKYAAPEVVVQESRGFPADIFPLGCVFLELCSALHDAEWGDVPCEWPSMPWSSMPTANKDEVDTPNGSACSSLQSLLATNVCDVPWYHANTDRLQEYTVKWHSRLTDHDQSRLDSVGLLQNMVHGNPQERPTATDLVAHFKEQSCCMMGREPMEVMECYQWSASQRDTDLL
jgi:serine/threonine protein kinase